MTPPADTARRRGIGYGVSVAVVLALLAVAVVNLVSPRILAEEYTTVSMAYEMSTRVGLLILACAILYAVPLTALLGAVLITGLALGVVLAHLRLGEVGGASQIFAVAVAGLAWLGLYLRRDEAAEEPPAGADGRDTP